MVGPSVQHFAPWRVNVVLIGQQQREYPISANCFCLDELHYTLVFLYWRCKSNCLWPIYEYHICEKYFCSGLCFLVIHVKPVLSVPGYTSINKWVRSMNTVVLQTQQQFTIESLVDSLHVLLLIKDSRLNSWDLKICLNFIVQWKMASATLGERSQFARSSLRRSKRKAQGFGQSKFFLHIHTYDIQVTCQQTSTRWT